MLASLLPPFSPWGGGLAGAKLQRFNSGAVNTNLCFITALQWYGLNDREEIRSYRATGRIRPTSATFLSDDPDIKKLKRVVYRVVLVARRDANEEIGTSVEEARISERQRKGLAVYSAAMTSNPLKDRKELIAEAVREHEECWPAEDPVGFMTASVVEPDPPPAASSILEEQEFKAVRLSATNL